MTGTKGTTQTKRATYELRRLILSGAFPGGTRLLEVALAERLDISRTPVREAMSRLAEEGLLERASGGGFEVRSFTIRDALDAIELRGVLEGLAARLAAEKGADAGRLAASVARMDRCFGETVDFDGYSEENAVFHERLAALCDSPMIEREIARVRSLPFASPSAFVLDEEGGALSFRSLIIAQDQHRALVEAIAAREGARAEAIAREHARIAKANLASSREQDAVLPGMALIRL